MNKQCTKCKIEKDLIDFHKSKIHSHGVRNICKVCTNEWCKDHYSTNKEIINTKHKIYRENNKDKEKLRHKIYLLNNKHITSKYHKTRRQTDINYRLKRNISNSIKSAFKRTKNNKNSKTREILGCSYEDFRSYIESKFQSWMSWENYGLYNGQEKHGWDLDHIVPVASGKNEEDLLKLNHYTNFQPLCSYTNRYIKIDKLEYV